MRPPFDVLTDRYVPYNIGDAAAARTALASAIRATLVSDRETDSPVFKMLPALHEIDPATVKAIPNRFPPRGSARSCSEICSWFTSAGVRVGRPTFSVAGAAAGGKGAVGSDRLRGRAGHLGANPRQRSR